MNLALGGGAKLVSATFIHNNLFNIKTIYFLHTVQPIVVKGPHTNRFFHAKRPMDVWGGGGKRTGRFQNF